MAGELVICPSHRGASTPEAETFLRWLGAQGVTIARASNISLICRGRSLLLSRAMQEGFERVMFWDDDLVPANPEAVLRMLRHEETRAEPFLHVPIVGGMYAQKGQPKLCADGVNVFRRGCSECGRKRSCFERGALPPGALKCCPDCKCEPTTIKLGTPGFLRCTHVATGAMVIPRQALELILEGKDENGEPLVRPCQHEVSGELYWDFFRPLLKPLGRRDQNFNPLPERWHYLGEDYSFCERVTRTGVSLCVATEPIIGHVGAFTWFVQDSLQATDGRLSPLAAVVELDDS